MQGASKDPQELERERSGDYCLMGRVWEAGNVLEMDGGDGCTTT